MAEELPEELEIIITPEGKVILPRLTKEMLELAIKLNPENKALLERLLGSQTPSE